MLLPVPGRDDAVPRRVGRTTLGPGTPGCGLLPALLAARAGLDGGQSCPLPTRGLVRPALARQRLVVVVVVVALLLLAHDVVEDGRHRGPPSQLVRVRWRHGRLQVHDSVVDRVGAAAELRLGLSAECHPPAPAVSRGRGRLLLVVGQA